MRWRTAGSLRKPACCPRSIGGLLVFSCVMLGVMHCPPTLSQESSFDRGAIEQALGSQDDAVRIEALKRMLAAKEHDSVFVPLLKTRLSDNLKLARSLKPDGVDWRSVPSSTQERLTTLAGERALILRVIEAIGAQAAPLLPELIELAEAPSSLDQDTPFIAKRETIRAIGKAAISPLIQELQASPGDEMKVDSRRRWAAALLGEIAGDLQGQGDTSALPDLERALEAVRKAHLQRVMASWGGGPFEPPILNAIQALKDRKRLEISDTQDVHDDLSRRRSRAVAAPAFSVDPAIESSLKSMHGVELNGKVVQVDWGPNSAITFLGDNPSDGLNVIQSSSGARGKVLVWLESGKLMKFEEPYKRSYAILAAIDDYERRKDPQRRGKTGFGQLGRMVTGAEALKNALIGLGFPPGHIITIYDDKANSKTINHALEAFWTGAEHSDADRVLFYFGGHGSSHGGNGFLVTYDYNANQPTLTSLLMRDLTERHSDNIEAKHFLVVLDACSSGLALRTLGDSGRDKVERKSFRQLSIIRNDTAFKARNVLLAGTDDQPALYDNGGILTDALIRGLKGDADLNHDGIIQFVELALFVKDEVAELASRKGIQQTVGYYKLTAGGATGEVLFIRMSGQ